MGPLWRQRYGRPVRKLCLRLGTTCPNRDGTRGRGGCLFCAEGDPVTPPPLDLQIARGLRRLGSGHAVIAYLQDHSATYLPARDLDRVLAAICSCPEVVAVTVGTRPDCLDDELLRLLGDRAARRPIMVELGLQTACEPTLRLINRRHTVACFLDATCRLQRAGIEVCAHVVLGLPSRGESGALVPEGAERAVETARLLGQARVQAVKIHNCHVLRGAGLARLYEKGRFCPPDLEGYCQLLVPFLEHLPPEVEIHRLTGEASFPRLLYPAFTADKARTLARIRAELQRLDTWQGAALPNAPR